MSHEAISHVCMCMLTWITAVNLKGHCQQQIVYRKPPKCKKHIHHAAAMAEHTAMLHPGEQIAEHKYELS